MAKDDDPWDSFVDRAIEHAPQIESENELYSLFYYQAEVNNGGHHQYFHNWPDEAEWARAASGARGIGQTAVADLIQRAATLWKSKARHRPDNMEGFMAEAREAEFSAFDDSFYEIEEKFQAAFERHVKGAEVR